MEELIEAVPQSPESFLYQAYAVEGAPDEERLEAHMQRRVDLLTRMTDNDREHIAVQLIRQEQSEKTRNLVRERRRIREREQARKEGLAKRHEAKKEVSLDAAKQYQEQLEEEFDEPKSKTRKRKAAPKQSEKLVKIDGRQDQETDGPSEE
jgi:hypothetical protein